MKKGISLLLAIVMLLGLLPAAVFATEAEYVYISVSYDDTYAADKDGGYIAYVPVSFETPAGIDLIGYGLRYEAGEGFRGR